MDSIDAFTIDPANAAIRAVDRPRFSTRLFSKRSSTYKLLFGDFSAFIEVATKKYKYAVNRAGGHLGGPL